METACFCEVRAENKGRQLRGSSVLESDGEEKTGRLV
jgi:hypothetical protein